MLLNGEILEVRIEKDELDSLDDLDKAKEFLTMAKHFGYSYYMNDDLQTEETTTDDLIRQEAKKIFVLVQVDLRYADEHRVRNLLN